MALLLRAPFGLPGTVIFLAARANELTQSYGFTAIEPYDADAVIAATGTIGLEIVADFPDVRAVFVPVGGGGLLSGVAYALKRLKPDIRVIGVEPDLAADARESKLAGHIVRWPVEQTGRTIADGLRVQQIGMRNWPLIRDHVDAIVTVGEDDVREAMRRIADEAKLVAEPSGAVAVAAALNADAGVESVAILSGGNSDLSFFAAILGDSREPRTC